MQVDLKVTVPEGYELTGEYRVPHEDEPFLNGSHEVTIAKRFPCIPRLILRKVPKWRDATLDDLKRVMDGETVECCYVDGQMRYTGFRLAGWNTNDNKRPVWAMLMLETPSELYYASKVQVKE